MNNELWITCGIPGSGKSTWAAEFQQRSNNETLNYKNIVILCPDSYRMEMTGRAFFAPAEEAVWSAVKVTARVLLRSGYNVMIDATNTSKSSRSQWVRIAKEIGVICACFWADTTHDVCKSRNANRVHPVPDDVLDRMIQDFENPAIEEGFRLYKLSEFKKHEV